MSLLKSELDLLADSKIILASAYLKLYALKDLATGHIAANNDVKVLTRWKPEDLLVGVSDLECYSFAKSMGWPFYIKQWFHAKVYLAGDRSALIGSSNLTQSGFGIGVKGNEEGMVRIPASQSNIYTLEKYFSDATLVTDDLFLKIQEWVIQNKNREHQLSTLHWPDTITSMFHKASALVKIGCSDCFWSDCSWVSNKNFIQSEQQELVLISHDLSLLGYQSIESFLSTPPANISQALNDTGIVRWLRSEIEKMAERETYFGALTATLHDALIDDPKPYRQDVKRFVSNLCGWLDQYSSEFSVDRPKHSQRIKLVR